MRTPTTRRAAARPRRTGRAIARRAATPGLTEALLEGLHGTLRSLILLLLARGELPQSLGRLIHLALRRLRALLLYRLVLVLQLVGVELEEVGQVLLLLSTTTAAATTTAALLPADLDVAIDGLRTLHMLQRPLRRRDRRARPSQSKRFFGILHVAAGRVELRLDRHEGAVLCSELTSRDAFGESGDILAELPLLDRERGEILTANPRGRLGAVANPVEGARHDLLLSRREFVRRGIAALASLAPFTTTGLAFLAGTIVHAERPDLEEVDVGTRRLPCPIAGQGVIGNQVTRFERDFLKKERVHGTQVEAISHQRVGERDPLLGTTVDTIAEFESRHAEVVGRSHRDGDLFRGGDLDVPARRLDPHARLTVLQRRDGILHRTRHHGTVGRGQVDAVEPVTRHDEVADHVAGRVHRERTRGPIVEAEGASLHRHGDLAAHSHRGASHGSHVTTILDLFHRETGVAGKAKLERHVRDRGKVHHRDRELG